MNTLIFFFIDDPLLQVGEKPALPVKRSKSMKSISKPVSVIPVINNNGEPSFSRDQYRLVFHDKT
jgi:hypothetical protein